MTKIAFIGAGSTVFMKNLIGDALLRPALADAHIALMDIDRARLDESALVARKLVASLGTGPASPPPPTGARRWTGRISSSSPSRSAATSPCTVTDFDIPKAYGLRQTIADTLGIGGIMRGLRTVPHIWAVAEDMRQLCPNALLMNYVNPMAINTWALTARYPDIAQVGLCHSVQGTAYELARDLGLDVTDLRYRAAGINHMAFYLSLEARDGDGWRDLYPACARAIRRAASRSKATGTRAAPTLSATR